MRTIIAFLVVPLILSVPWATYALFQSAPLQDRLVEFLLVTVMAYAFVALFNVLFALPLFLTLQHFNLVNFWTAVLSGMAIGGVGALLFGHVLWLSGAWISGLGGLAGLVFWLVWRQPPGRPESIER